MGKNLVGVILGFAAASFAIRWWIRREAAVCGLVSGGTQVVPPNPGAGTGS